MPTIRVFEEALAKTPPSVPLLKLSPSIPRIKLWNVPAVEVPFEKESLEWAAREGERKQAAIVTRDATLAMLEEIGAERRLARRTFLGHRRYIRRLLLRVWLCRSSSFSGVRTRASFAPVGATFKRSGAVWGGGEKRTQETQESAHDAGFGLI
jgi:hypothetical protein